MLTSGRPISARRGNSALGQAARKPLERLKKRSIRREDPARGSRRRRGEGQLVGIPGIVPGKLAGQLEFYSESKQMGKLVGETDPKVVKATILTERS